MEVFTVGGPLVRALVVPLERWMRQLHDPGMCMQRDRTENKSGGILCTAAAGVRLS
jgi:hypothetical protein